MSASRKNPKQPSSPSSPSAQALVDPIWLVKAALSVIIIAAVCAYVAICALFWHSQWQIVLSPSRNITATPANANLPFQEVGFGPGAGGNAELTGWWIPATEPNVSTVLLLHGGSGTMSDVLSQAKLLHDNRLNVFVFDYRGFGRSHGAHPTQQQMEQDSEAALRYLHDIRQTPPSDVIALGEGLGASLATKLCAEHHDISALILENADGDFETRAVLDSRSRMVPVSLLFTQTFSLADPLHTLATPKLLISYTKSAVPPVDFARAGDPKLTVELASPEDTVSLSQTLQRFLDSYIRKSPNVLLPSAPSH